MFDEASFQGRTDFSGISSGGDVSLARATFYAEAIFVKVKVVPPSMLYLGDEQKGFAEFRHESTHYAERAFRIAKQTALDSGRYVVAGEYNYKERVYFRQWRRGRWNVLRIAEWLFADFIFGYGERPFRVVRTAAIVIGLWALLFLFTGIKEIVGCEIVKIDRRLWFNPDQLLPTLGDFLRCLYFSAISFATLGYGDFQPLSWGSRTLAALEGLFGIVLMALFAVTIAKRFARG